MVVEHLKKMITDKKTNINFAALEKSKFSNDNNSVSLLKENINETS